MKSKFKKLLATALVLCLVLALLPAAAFADGNLKVTFSSLGSDVDNGGEYALATMTATGAINVNGQFDNGEQVTLSFSAKQNERIGIAALIVNGTTEDIKSDPEHFEYTFPITQNTTVQAEFRRYFDVEASCDTQGAVTFVGLQSSYMRGMPVTFQINLNGTYATTHEIQSITYGTEGQDGTSLEKGADGYYTFDMPAGKTFVDVTLTEREVTEHTITYINDGNGTVTSNPANSASYRQTITVTATPNTGYEVNQIMVFDATAAGATPEYLQNNATYTMPDHDIIISATFKEIEAPTTKHSIILENDNTRGTLDSNKATASAKETVTITATPYNGYKTVEVYYILSGQYGLKVPARYVGDNQWQFTMPNAAVEVYATFKYDPYYPGTDLHYINVSNPGWHCSVVAPSSAYCGESVTIKLSNFDAGYAFSYLKVNGEYVTPYGFNGYLSYTFTMPHNNVAIEVGTTSVSGKYYIDTSYDSTLGGVEVWVNNNYVGNNWHQGSWADYNDSVSFKVKPYYSDDVVSVSVVGKQTGRTYSYDYNSYSGWYTFSMPREDVTISVDFRSGVHKVYVDKVTDGKLTVSDDWAKYGQIVYITAVPDYGCTLSSLSVRTATGDSVRVYNAQKADTYYFYMPDQYVSVSAVFTGKYTSLPFNDVSYGDWYYDAVQFVYSKGIMDGVDYYKFAPNGTITRGMILTMLWRMAGEPFEMPVTSFTDVEIGRYYTTAVAWACRNGIADGMGESTFGPNDAITREELVTLLYRYAQYFGHSCIGTSIEGFADAGSVSSYAYNAMCWAYKAGVVTGTTGSRLNPQGTASRAEAAQMIMSFYSFLNS